MASLTTTNALMAEKTVTKQSSKIFIAFYVNLQLLEGSIYSNEQYSINTAQ